MLLENVVPLHSLQVLKHKIKRKVNARQAALVPPHQLREVCLRLNAGVHLPLSVRYTRPRAMGPFCSSARCSGQAAHEVLLMQAAVRHV